MFARLQAVLHIGVGATAELFWFTTGGNLSSVPHRLVARRSYCKLKNKLNVSQVWSRIIPDRDYSTATRALLLLVKSFEGEVGEVVCGIYISVNFFLCVCASVTLVSYLFLEGGGCPIHSRLPTLMHSIKMHVEESNCI